MGIPIIEVSNISNATIIDIEQTAFFKSYKTQKPEQVFKIKFKEGSQYVWNFYPKINGVYFKILGDDSETWEEFMSYTEKWQSSGFLNKEEYQKAVEFTITNKEDYTTFMDSRFLSDLKEFIIQISGGHSL